MRKLLLSSLVAMGMVLLSGSIGALCGSVSGSLGIAIAQLSGGTNPSSPRAVVDLAAYGSLTCGGDATASMAAAISALAPNGGGTILIPCNVIFSSQILIPSGFKILGEAAYGATNPLWSPNGSGIQNPTIVCGNQTASCLRINGFGIEIAGLQFTNPEPTPPPTGTSWPGIIVYPPIIDTSSSVSWGDVYIHNVKCIPCSKFIDLEGTSTYTAYAGTQTIIRDVLCSPCLNNGIIAHLIDNPLLIDHVEWTPNDYYFSYAAVGAYLRANATGLDFKYVAAPVVRNVFPFALKYGWTFENDTVTNNFGSLTFAVSALQADNIQFDQVCQAIVAPGGNGTNTSAGGQATDGAFINFAKFNQIDIWGDQSGFQCAKGKKLIQLETNQGNVSFSNLNVYTADQVFAFGCGTVGTGSCPAGGPAGNIVVRLDNVDVSQYGEWTAGTPFLTAPSNTSIPFGTTNLSAIRPASGAGNIMAPGLDGTQAYMGFIGVGGGSNPIEGSVLLQGSGNTTNTGLVSFWDTSRTRHGYVGYANSGGLDLETDSGQGSVFIKPGGTSIGNFSTGGLTIEGSISSSLGEFASIGTDLYAIVSGSTIVGDFSTGGLTLSGASLISTTSPFYLKVNTGTVAASFGVSGSTVIVNFGSLPTSCTGLSVGTVYVPSAHVLGVC